MNTDNEIKFPTLNDPPPADVIRFPTLNDPAPHDQEFDAHLQAAKIPAHPQQIWHADQAVAFAGEDPGKRFDAHLAAAKIPRNPNKRAHVQQVLNLAGNDLNRLQRIPEWMKRPSRGTGVALGRGGR